MGPKRRGCAPRGYRWVRCLQVWHVRKKAYIRRHIAMGWTKSRIVDSLVGPPNNLGPSVLGVPQKHGFDLLAWVLPLAGIAAGAVALAAGAWVWSRNRPGGSPLLGDRPALDPALDRRVDEELARYDG